MYLLRPGIKDDPVRRTKRARRLFPGWEADLVPVTVSLVNREDAKTIGLDIREPRQFLHDALPRAHRYLERFDHRVIDDEVTPVNGPNWLTIPLTREEGRHGEAVA